MPSSRWPWNSGSTHPSALVAAQALIGQSNAPGSREGLLSGLSILREELSLVWIIQDIPSHLCCDMVEPLG